MQLIQPENNIQFLADGGEMGRLTREKDWSKTSLGPAGLWPQSLRTTLSIILNSKFPMFLFWGPELICFYNDAYRPSLGAEGKHPYILGGRADIYWDEIWPIIKPLIDQVLRGEEAVWREDQLIPIYRNGRIEDVYWTFSYSPVNDESGKPAGVLVTCCETTAAVTTRAKLEDQIAQSDVLRLLIENVSDFIGMCDLEFRPFYINRGGRQLTGLDDAYNLNDPAALDFFFPEDVAMMRDEFFPKVLAAGRNEMEVRFRNFKNGEAIWMIYNVILLTDAQGLPTGYATVSKNITERKRVEDERKETHQRFLNTLMQAPVAMCVFKGKDHVVEIANELMLELWGKTEREVSGRPVFEALPEAKGQGLELVIDSVFNTGERFSAYEHPVSLLRDNGPETIYINFVYEPLKESAGTTTGIVAVAVDVTLQVMARKKIEQSEARIRSLITQAPMAMVVLSGPEHLIEMANSAMLKRWNKTPREVENKTFGEIFPEIKDQKFPALLDHVYRTGQTYRENESVSYIQDKSRKTTFYVDFEYAPLLDFDGNVSGVIATVNDVTEKVASRKKIEESEERYHNLIYSSPSAIGILHGEDLIITIANDAIIEIWGKGKEIMGKAYFEALPELADQGYKEVFAQVYKTGQAFNAVETPVYLVQNGVMVLRYYNFLLYPQRDINGEIDGIGIIATEVTSQALLNERIKESERRFRLLADSMPQHVWTADAAGNLNYFNQSVFDYSGLSPEQIADDGWMQIVHPDDRERNAKEWMRSVKTGKDFLFEHRFLKHTGEYRWQLSRAVPQRDEHGEIQLWVGTSTDIQQQKTFAKELEQQVQERTKELAQNNIELAKMNKELQSFAYISSHDLQEPLRKIQTFAAMIVDRELDNLSDAGKDFFERMQNAARRMQTLIDDLLAYSRANTAERKCEKTDLNKVVAEVKAALREELQQKKATIEATALSWADIIPFQFRQLLHNLVSNSLKFSRYGVPPLIKIKSEIAYGSALGSDKLLSDKQYCHVHFSDNGIGFEQQYSERIFELFQRLHGRHEFQGTGIGLAIVKKIVDNHEGVITARGEVNKGAAFDIYFPSS